MRRLGAAARQMLLQAAAARLDVPVSTLSTEPGRVCHAGSGRVVDYGALAAEAAALSVPEQVSLRAEKDLANEESLPTWTCLPQRRRPRR
jgi:isoquinoline 1-oxidoreductase beta subunit